MPNNQSIIKSSFLKKGVLIALLIAVAAALQGCPAIIVGAAGGAALAVHDRRDSDTILADQKIESVATNKIYQDEKLEKKIHANVTSYNRTVLLTGEVLAKDLREHTANLVRNIPGVKRVYNELVVADLTSFNSRSNDSWITSKIKTKMLNAKDLDSTRVKVVTENSVAFLMGMVTDKESAVAVDIARNVKGVSRVVKIFEIIPEPVEPKSAITDKSTTGNQ